MEVTNKLDNMSEDTKKLLGFLTRSIAVDIMEGFRDMGTQTEHEREQFLENIIEAHNLWADYNEHGDGRIRNVTKDEDVAACLNDGWIDVRTIVRIYNEMNEHGKYFVHDTERESAVVMKADSAYLIDYLFKNMYNIVCWLFKYGKDTKPFNYIMQRYVSNNIEEVSTTIEANFD